MILILTLSCLLLANAQPLQEHKACENCTEELCFEPHPYNCNQYYMCNNENVYVMNCPANLQFNPLINVCDYPESVECINTPMPTEGTTTTPKPQTNVTEEAETTTIEDVETINKMKGEPKCHESEDGMAVILPNPHDCTKFYICVGTVPVEKTCKPGLFFNPELSVCDWPENVPQCNQ